MLFLLELAGIGLALVWILLTAPEGRPGRVLARAVLVAASAWAVEESSMRLYGFYGYDQSWQVWIGRVPLLVVIVWPVIVFSAMDLMSGCSAAAWRSVLPAAAVVAADALFIEPLSVSAGLWRWSVPGLFGAPPIGILGWFFFAGLCLYLVGGGRLRAELTYSDLMLLVLPVLGTHLLLLLSWWGALRWISVPLNAYGVVAAAWFSSLFLAAIVLRKGLGRRVRRKTLLLRIPAALFFISLIPRTRQWMPLLALYALAFVSPYALMMLQQYRGVHAATGPAAGRVEFD